MKAIDRSDWVKFIIVAFVILAALLVANSPVFAQGAIACGETVTGEITDEKWTDEWTLVGAAEQTVFIWMWDIQGFEDSRQVDSYLSLLSPSGNRLAYNDNVDKGDAGIRYQFEADATYKILASRNKGEKGRTTGRYEMSVRCLGNTMESGGGAVSCGGLAAGEITDDNWSDLWTIEGVAGQTIYISMWDVQGFEDTRAVDSFLSLHTPSGRRLNYNDNYDGNDAALSFTFEHTATYTIQATRSGSPFGSTTGRYEVSVRCLETALGSGGGEVSCGAIAEGEITFGNWLDAWTFDGVAGQTIYISMWDVQGFEDPRAVDSFLSLHTPGGRRLNYNDDYDGNDAALSFKFEHTATYTIQAMRSGGAFASTEGRYEISVRCLAQALGAGGGAVSCGAMAEGEITFGNWLDAWTFDGVEGQTVYLSMRDVQGFEDPRAVDSFLSLHTPGGRRLNYNDDYDGNDAALSFKFEHTATYTIQAMRSGGAFGSTTGRYEMSVRCLEQALSEGGGTIICGDSVSGEITFDNWVDYWTFTAGAGEELEIWMRDVERFDDPRTLDSYLSLHTPIGRRLAYNDDSDNRDARIRFRLDNTASYTIRARRAGDAFGASSGHYELELTCAGTGEPIAPKSEPAAPADQPDPHSPRTPTGASPTRSLEESAGLLLGIDRVSCSPNDSYFILSLKSAALSPRLFEITVSTQGNARIARILPIPAHGAETQEALTALGISLVGDGIETVFHIPFASTMLVAGAEMGAWIDQQFERNQGAFDFRWTWYNTTVHPAINDYLVHVTHSGDGIVSLSTRQAPMSDLALYARQNADQRPEAKGNKLADWLSSAGDWVMDKVWGEPLAYWAERLFREDFVAKTDPLTICP